MIKVFWPKSPSPGNLGDILTPIMLREMGIEYTYVGPDQAELLMTGSIARFAEDGCRVIGSGIMSPKDLMNPKADWRVVRGPLTRAAILNQGGFCPENYGDAALAYRSLVYVPRPYKRFMEKGFVPHYVDYLQVTSKYGPDRTISTITNNPTTTISLIGCCSKIYSSSLHGIILAHSMGVPAAWVKWSNKLDGHPEDMKFLDYAMSVGIKLIPYKNVDEAIPILPETDRIDECAENVLRALDQLKEDYV